MSLPPPGPPSQLRFGYRVGGSYPRSAEFHIVDRETMRGHGQAAELAIALDLWLLIALD